MSGDGGAVDSSTPEPRSDYSLAHDRPDPVDFPRLCPEVDPIGGYLRVRYEDFEVEEIPLYEFCGEGEHCYVTFRKLNRTTMQARDLVARSLGVSREDIGFAGHKDKRASTVQTFSIVGVDSAAVEALEIPNIEVLAVTRHRNKLRAGHLAGNRFRIRIREVPADADTRARKVIERAAEVGLPNFYGHQRFGAGSVGYLIGEALLHRDPERVCDLILGPNENYSEEHRQLYAERKYDEAYEALGPGRQTEAALLNALRRYPDNKRAAARRIPGPMRRLYYSAYQSFLFNWALKERLVWREDALSVPEEGDLAYIHRSGNCFQVEDAEDAGRRAAADELSPSAPIFGRKVALATERPGAMEWAILDRVNLRPQSFLAHAKGLKLDGTRRACRIILGEVTTAMVEPDVLELGFTLPSGSYATTLLEQIMGPGQAAERFPDRLLPEQPGPPEPSGESAAEPSSDSTERGEVPSD